MGGTGEQEAIWLCDNEGKDRKRKITASQPTSLLPSLPPSLPPYQRPRTALGFLLCTKRDLLILFTSVEVWKEEGREGGKKMERKKG